MARNYKRDGKGRFASVSGAKGKLGKFKARRANKKAAKSTYRRDVGKARAKFNRDLSNISSMSDAEYNRHVRKGTYAGGRIAGQDLSSAVYDTYRANRGNAKAKYKRTLQGSKVKT